jgi:cell fate regulator YaaT (PSP1 superfamily)
MSPEVVEVTFKRNRKGYFLNIEELKLKVNDFVVVEVEKGIDLGQITQLGRLVILKDIKSDLKNIQRLANEADLEKIKENRCKEMAALQTCKELVLSHKLNMKLVDVEYQFDTNKLTFFFTSDKRVDFRALVKDLASKYRTRIELRQISVREEARKLGGLGICGNSLCCCSFMCNFSPITTADAKNQNLPMNPAKLSGVCGRLKCCILFEKKFYSDALKRFPLLDSAIQTEKGTGYVDKLDIFNNFVFLRYDDDEYEQYDLDKINKLLKKQASQTKRIKEKNLKD